MEARKTTVLLIEDGAEGGKPDVPDSLESLKSVLNKMAGAESAQVSMEFADHIAAGLARLQEGGVDVVLLDVSRPGSNGETGMKSFLQLKERDASVPVVVVGDKAQKHVASEAVKQGARDFLVKDELDGRVLLQSIRYAMQIKKTRR